VARKSVYKQDRRRQRISKEKKIEKKIYLFGFQVTSSLKAVTKSSNDYAEGEEVNQLKAIAN